jgi:hypothetical protein
MARVKAARRVPVRRLVWDVPGGAEIHLEQHQLSAERWKDDPYFSSDDWLAIPSVLTGYVVVSRAFLRPARVRAVRRKRT